MTKKKPTAAPVAAAPVEPVYRIAEGKALTSLRGIQGSGAVVDASYFSGGQKTLDANVASGHVIKS